jgi:hypothetical protein
MPAPLPFLPQTIARAAEKYRLARPLRLSQCVGVHEAEHQDLAGAGVLNNRGNQPAAFFKCDIHVLSPKHRIQKQKTRRACCASGPMSTFSNELLRTTQRARLVAVMMMVRPEVIQNAHC